MSDVAIPSTLSFDEVAELDILELKIEAGLKTFYEVGDALLGIRDGKLYREEYGTFEDYCEKKWQMKRNYANKLIASAETLNALGTIVPKDELPKNEGQMRALNSFDAELQPAIVRLANGYAKATGKPVTAGMFERVGGVLEEAELTGHVDTGSGESSALFAAIAATEYEATARQKQYQKQHYETHDAQGKVKPEEKERRSLDIHYSSQTSKWNTPSKVLEAVYEVLGDLDLDPCSNEGKPNVKAARHYAEADDGLSHSWVGKVFMNPPYGKEIGEWTEKLHLEFSEGNTSEAIALLPARTDTVWCNVLRQYPRCFIRGRLKFGESEDGAPFPSMAVYLGPQLLAFTEVFKPLGDIYVLFDA